MTIYETTDPIIISTYNIYLELKIFISQLEEAKKYLLDNQITRQTNNYMILSSDSSSYANFKKVFKIVFKEMLNREQFEKFIIFYQYFENKYYVSPDNNQIYLNKKPRYLNIKFESFEISNDTLIFQGIILNELKRNLKILLKALIANQEIKAYYN